MAGQSNRIRELRESRGWTAQELAERANVWSPQIYKWESGRHTPTLASMHAIAMAFGLPLGDVFPPEQPKPAPRKKRKARAS
jgi:transcriptional regulator with XRE-family HTH domain